MVSKKCLLARGFGIERARLGGALRYARGLSAHGFRARLAGALRYARGLSAHGCGTERARPGHFASLVVSKKVPPTYGDFDFFFPKYRRF